jgi:phosphatidylglycerol:prolipoprotein diacylglycerol transferase
MFPKLFELGPITVYTYGLLLAAAYLAGLQLALYRARRAGLDANKVMDLGIWVIVSALVGAKALLILIDFDYFVEHPGDIFSVARAAGVFYGGLIAAVSVGFWLIRKYQLPFWTTCDLFAPGIALGHTVGRLGCFAAGCCFGRETHVPWAVTFTNPLATQFGTPLHVPLHPTQLYESAAELLILVGLLAFERRGRQFPGRTFWAYMAVYAISRFVIEIYRGDQRGFVMDALSTSQFISVLLLPLSLVMLYVLSRRPTVTGTRPPARRARTA